ncbi:substrate-binding domain-containing protein [Ruminococcus gauvreauii]|uniref:Substrate-binding domain-containing protein n=1 Tax=Ruminococcus gauvreauii TaxID=438033 RepID=A0ABY5VEQ7_9FIRM|nr:substrate-binding domain-containing protein [Ruminococcus gauvreauii]UWP57933.1 substrate-binding domain-containing protein [Ruminococcus gauvreauii]
MKKRTLIAGLLAASMIITAAAGCGAADGKADAADAGTTEDAGKPKEGGTSEGGGLKVGAATRTLRDSVYIVMRDNAQEEADKLGIDLSWQDCNIDVSVQKSQIENMIASGTDVLIVEAADQKSMSETVTDAQNQGIPVIIIEARIDNFTPDLWVTADSYQVGVQQVDEFIKKWGTTEPANVVLLSGTQGDEVAESISAGVRDQVAEYDNLTLVYEQSCMDWARDKGMAYMEDAISTNNGNIQAVFGNNDQITMGALKAAENAGLVENMWFIGGDHEEEMVKYILDGYNVMTVDKGTEAQGKFLIDAAEMLANGETIPDTQEIDGINVWYAPTTMVNADNVKEFSAGRYPDLFK